MIDPGDASARIARREQRHRRAVLLGIAVLIVLGMSPLFGHHLPIGLDVLWMGRAPVRDICLIALHAILHPLHGVFHVLYLAGLSYAVWDRLRAWHSLNRALAPLTSRAPLPDSANWSAALAGGVDPERVRVVEGLPAPAFTAGWLRPRVYVAAELEARLSFEELAAVFAHEGVHASRRDPLRLSLLRFLACTLFWIPALRRLASDVAAEGEVRADDQAAERHGLALASALVQLASWGQMRSPLAVGFTGEDLLERRVLRLTGEEVRPRSHLTRRSLAGAGGVLLLALSSCVAAATRVHALHEAQCHDHSEPLAFHLFCDA